MYRCELNWNEIRPDLLIGCCPFHPEDMDRIREGSGATAMLSLQHAECHENLEIDWDAHRERASRSSLRLENAPMRDFDAEDQRRNLPAAVRRLHRLLSDGHRVYVHCTAGINRAPLTVLGYLVFVERMDPAAALHLIQGQRSQAEPYLDAFEGCRRDLGRQHEPAIRDRAHRLSQECPDAGAGENWLRAEAEIIREALIAPDDL